MMHLAVKLQVMYNKLLIVVSGLRCQMSRFCDWMVQCLPLSVMPSSTGEKTNAYKLVFSCGLDKVFGLV